MKNSLIKISGSVLCLFVFSGVLLAKPRQNPVSKKTLAEAVDNAKKGDRAKLKQMTNTVDEEFDEELLPDLIVLLKENDAQIQLVATRGLSVLKNKKSKDALVDYLSGKDYVKLEKSMRKGELAQDQYAWHIHSAAQAIIALGEVGDKSVIPLLESLRNIKDIHNIEGAGSPVETALANLGADGFKSVSKLNKNAKDEEVSRAARAISRIRDKNQLPSLVATVKDDACAEGVRAASVTAIVGIQGSNAMPFVVSIIREKTYPACVRSQAMFEACKYGYNEGVDVAIQELVDESGSGIRPKGMFHLAKLSPEKHLRKAIEFIMDKKQPPVERVTLSGLFDIQKIDSAVVKQNRELFLGCLKAVQADGAPADEVRSNIWLVLYMATGEELDLELSGRDAGAAEMIKSRLKHTYSQKCHGNTSADELRAEAQGEEVFAKKVKFVKE